MPSLKHTHSFVRYKRTEKTVWFKCADPECTAIYDREMVTGKASLCPKCKTTVFILDSQAVKRAEPLCLECRNTKEGRAHRRAKTLVAGMLSKLNDETDKDY